MAVTRRSAGPWISAIVAESLGAVLSPAHVEQVITHACVIGDLPHVPETPAALRVFLEGPLFAALSERLELGDALELLSQTRGALRHVLGPDEIERSDIRPRRAAASAPSPRLSSEPASPPERRPVLVVTQASLVVFLLQDMLGEDVTIRVVSTEDDLVERLARARRPVTLVVDRKHPVVGPEAAPHLRALPAGSAVLWWGGSEYEQLRVRSAVDEFVTLVCTEAELRLADLGELCRSLVED